MGCTGDGYLQTPAIDSLAKNGVFMTNFYVSSPLCVPNRCSLMTGRMPSVHGSRTNGIPLHLKSTTFVDVLRSGGYKTAVIGKTHFQNVKDIPAPQERCERKPNHKAIPPDMKEAVKELYSEGNYDQELSGKWENDPDHRVELPYYGFDHAEFAILHGDVMYGHYSRWLDKKHPDVRALRGPENSAPSNKSVMEAWKTRVPEEAYPTSYIADRSVDYIERHVENGTDQPFYLNVSFPDPHHPFTPPGKYWDMYDPEQVRLPASIAGGEQPLPPSLRAVRSAERYRDEIQPYGYLVNASEKEAREAIALTYGQISMIDDAIGKILNILKNNGLLDETIVVFTSDHGDFMGDHGMILKGPLHYQGLVKVPFIWCDPEGQEKGRRVSSLATTIDIAPTILERVGLEPYNGIQGKSLIGVISGAEKDARPFVLIEDECQQRMPGFPRHSRVRTIVSKTHRLSKYESVEWGELYDLTRDPHEMRNLWDDPDHADSKAMLMESLILEMMKHTDPSPFPMRRT